MNAGFWFCVIAAQPRPSPVTENLPGGGFLCASCVSVFHHLRDTSGHNRWNRPPVWLPPHKHKHTHTHIHIHTAAHTDTFIFNGIIYFVPHPHPSVHGHISPVTYRCCLLSTHVEPVIRNQMDQVLSFTRVHMNGAVTLRWGTDKHLQRHHVRHLWHLMSRLQTLRQRQTHDQNLLHTRCFWPTAVLQSFSAGE